MEKKEKGEKEKGRCGERRKKNHVKDAQIIVIWKKRARQQEKGRGNQCIITAKPRKEAKGSTGRKDYSSLFTVFTRFNYSLFFKVCFY